MKVSRGARRLFELIHRFIHKSSTGRFFASQRWIAGNLKTSVRSVARWTAELVAGGYIIHSTGRQSKATYHVLKDLPPVLASHFGMSLASHLASQSRSTLILSPSECNSPSGSELPSEGFNKKAVIVDASERLANKNLKSQIAAQLRSSNRMPVPKMPPVPERLRDAVRHAEGRY